MELPSKDVRYTHTPLNFKDKEIRLITIEPTTDPSSPIHITIKNVDFSEHSDALTRHRIELARWEALHGNASAIRDSPTYNACLQGTIGFVAVSYTWGPELPAQDILVTSSECQGWLSIRQNLYEFLKIRRDWLFVRQSVDDFLETRQGLGSTSFWIDQICINQGQNDEKGHQVNQMADIYDVASVVEAWLGSGFDGSNELVDLIIYESVLSRQSPPPKISVSEQELHTLIPSLRQFVSLPYWSRLWITQEIVLGRVVQIHIGPRTLSWDTFYQGWLRLEKAWNGLHDVEKFEDMETKEGKGLFRIHQIHLNRGDAAKDWNSVRRLLQGTECQNLRDRVFGMMGMLHPSLRLYPDYSMHPQDILLELLTKQVALAFNDMDLHRKRNDYFVRKDCIRTAANWLPQLDGGTSQINPRSVRHHILKIAPLTPIDLRYGTSRVTRDRLGMIPNDPIPWCRLLLWKPFEPGYKFERSCRLKYYIWKEIPNERNMLWRIVRDHNRYVYIPNNTTI